jgi:SAM-dependent methyltransferase
MARVYGIWIIRPLAFERAMSKTYKKTIYETLGRDPVHPFPARMAPGIALDIIAAQSEPIRVLDPMMGSGTVLAVARARGHAAVGIDIDPLAVLLARVWTTAVDVNKVERKAKEVLARAKDDFSSRRACEAYPGHADSETRKFIRYWFDEYARRQLASLAETIRLVKDDRVRDALWCAFSRLIITKQSGVSLAMDLSHSRPHKVFDRAPIKPFTKFIAAVHQVLRNCIGNDQRDRGPTTRARLGDARKLPIANGTIDLVLTSPPYLNAIDYMRCSKFSLVWMGYTVGELGGIRTDSVGTECGDLEASENDDVRRIIAGLKLSPQLSVRNEAILAHYIEDMHGAVKETARVLSPEGKAVYVIGENTVRGTFIPNAKIVTAVAELSGLKVDHRRARALPANRRYLPPPTVRNSSEGLEGRMRREVILSFSKGG